MDWNGSSVCTRCLLFFSVQYNTELSDFQLLLLLIVAFIFVFMPNTNCVTTHFTNIGRRRISWFACNKFRFFCCICECVMWNVLFGCFDYFAFLVLLLKYIPRYYIKLQAQAIFYPARALVCVLCIELPRFMLNVHSKPFTRDSSTRDACRKKESSFETQFVREKNSGGSSSSKK